MSKVPLDPFRPGPGGTPPHLAGREAEQKLFAKWFAALRQGVPLARPVVLYGPRGNGKTALLNWVEQQAEPDPGLDVDSLTPSDLPDAGAVAAQLELTSWLQRVAPDSVSVAGAGASFRVREAPTRLAQALEARARSRPFVLLLDEAHMLEPEVGRLLLNAARRAASRAPFLFVLAGTPDLRPRLSRIGASFWSRSKQIPLGRLSDAATAEAVRVPLEREGIEVEEEALARIVAASHGYPYFVQVWGSAVWEQVHETMPGELEAPRRLSAVVVDGATEVFDTDRHLCYLERYEELQARSLLPAAREVAAAFADRETLTDPQLTDSQLHDALDRADAADSPPRAEAEETLRRLGYIWRSGGMPRWEPGIPSLMDFILEHAEPPVPAG